MLFRAMLIRPTLAKPSGRMLICPNSGLFVPLHFRSRERKAWRRFSLPLCSRGTFVPWNIRSLELSLLWNFRSSGTNVPSTFFPMKLSFHENEYSKNLGSKCPKTGYKPYNYNSLRALITSHKQFSATDVSAMQCWRKGVEYR